MSQLSIQRYNRDLEVRARQRLTLVRHAREGVHNPTLPHTGLEHAERLGPFLGLNQEQYTEQVELRLLKVMSGRVL